MIKQLGNPCENQSSQDNATEIYSMIGINLFGEQRVLSAKYDIALSSTWVMSDLKWDQRQAFQQV